MIDNADLLLDDDMRSYIALDESNQYIIIGRGVSYCCSEQKPEISRTHHIHRRVCAF